MTRHQNAPRKFGFMSAVLSCLLSGVPALSAHDSSQNTTLSPKDPAAAVMIQFRPHIVSSTKYDYNNDGEVLHHTLQTLSGTHGDLQLDETVVDNNGLIGVTLFCKGKKVFSKELPRWKGLCENSFVFIDPLKNESCNKSPIFRDINGDGIPEMVLTEDDGSAHGPVDQTIYQIKSDGKPPVELVHATLNGPEFKDIEHNGKYSMVVTDTSFAYWKGAAYCDSYPLQVSLSLQGHTWVPNTKLMKSPPLTRADLNKEVSRLKKILSPFKKIEAANKRAVTPEVWSSLVYYIYNGNADTSKQIYDTLYPDGTALIIAVNGADGLTTAKGLPTLPKKQFWKDLTDTATKGVYGKQVLELDTKKVLQSK